MRCHSSDNAMLSKFSEPRVDSSPGVNSFECAALVIAIYSVSVHRSACVRTVILHSSYCGVGPDSRCPREASKLLHADLLCVYRGST